MWSVGAKVRLISAPVCQECAFDLVVGGLLGLLDEVGTKTFCVETDEAVVFPVEGDKPVDAGPERGRGVCAIGLGLHFGEVVSREQADLAQTLRDQDANLQSVAASTGSDQSCPTSSDPGSRR